MGIINKILLTLSILIGLSAYLPSILLILKNKIKPSFCTWSLWTLLNIIVLIGLVKNQAPYSIAIAYTIGTTIMSLLVLFKKQFTWNKGDTLILILIFVSCFFLLFDSSFVAIIVGSLASFTAGIPEIRKAIQNPKNVSRLTAILFITANLLVIITTDKLIFINIIYPLSWIIFWTINLSLSFRKNK